MKHLVEFRDQSAEATGKRNDAITLSYLGNESLQRIDVNGIPFIIGNSSGLVKLGEILIQLGLSKYKSGFQLCIHENFDVRKDEILMIGIDGPGGADEESH